jgi:hypothetical protein
MTAPEHTAQRELALTLLARRTGPAAGAEAIAAAAERAYDDLTRVLAPVIGDIGVNALTDRALHLAQREYPWLLVTREHKYVEAKFSQIAVALKPQDPAVATEAAAAVLATILGLLATFVGEALGERLVRQAWPGLFQRQHRGDITQ